MSQLRKWIQIPGEDKSLVQELKGNLELVIAFRRRIGTNCKAHFSFDDRDPLSHKNEKNTQHHEGAL